MQSQVVPLGQEKTGRKSRLAAASLILVTATVIPTLAGLSIEPLLLANDWAPRNLELLLGIEAAIILLVPLVGALLAGGWSARKTAVVGLAALLGSLAGLVLQGGGLPPARTRLEPSALQWLLALYSLLKAGGLLAFVAGLAALAEMLSDTPRPWRSAMATLLILVLAPVIFSLLFAGLSQVLQVAQPLGPTGGLVWGLLALAALLATGALPLKTAERRLPAEAVPEAPALWLGLLGLAALLAVTYGLLVLSVPLLLTQLRGADVAEIGRHVAFVTLVFSAAPLLPLTLALLLRQRAPLAAAFGGLLLALGIAVVFARQPEWAVSLAAAGLSGAANGCILLVGIWLAVRRLAHGGRMAIGLLGVAIGVGGMLARRGAPWFLAEGEFDGNLADHAGLQQLGEIAIALAAGGGLLLLLAAVLASRARA